MDYPFLNIQIDTIPDQIKGNYLAVLAVQKYKGDHERDDDATEDKQQGLDNMAGQESNRAKDDKYDTTRLVVLDHSYQDDYKKSKFHQFFPTRVNGPNNRLKFLIVSKEVIQSAYPELIQSRKIIKDSKIDKEKFSNLEAKTKFIGLRSFKEICEFLDSSVEAITTKRCYRFDLKETGSARISEDDDPFLVSLELSADKEQKEFVRTEIIGLQEVARENDNRRGNDMRRGIRIFPFRDSNSTLYKNSHGFNRIPFEKQEEYQNAVCSNSDCSEKIWNDDIKKQGLYCKFCNLLICGDNECMKNIIEHCRKNDKSGKTNSLFGVSHRFGGNQMSWKTRRDAHTNQEIARFSEYFGCEECNKTWKSDTDKDSIYLNCTINLDHYMELVKQAIRNPTNKLSYKALVEQLDAQDINTIDKGIKDDGENREGRATWRKTTMVRNNHVRYAKERFNSYYFRDCIGKGAYGRVYLALTRKNKKIVAIKVMCKRHAINEGITKNGVETNEIPSLLNEKKFYTKKEIIEHKFITQAIETFHDSKFLYYVTEFNSGGEFRKYMDGQIGNRLPEKQIKQYGLELLLAIRHLHSLNIIHRDIKSENVMIGSDGFLKLIDFGTVKFLKEEGKNESERPEVLYSQRGTLTAMSPELLDSYYDDRTDENVGEGYSYPNDIWAWGIFMFECSTGEDSPFPLPEKYPANLLIKKIKECKPTFNHVPIEVKESLSQEFKDILLTKVLLKNQHDRLTADELINLDYFQQLKPDLLEKKALSEGIKPAGPIPTQDVDEILGKMKKYDLHKFKFEALKKSTPMADYSYDMDMGDGKPNLADFSWMNLKAMEIYK